MSNDKNADTLGPASLPAHVCIIMDGNGRWAQRRGLPRFMGHRAGVEAVRRVLQSCAQAGIKVLTLFAFSSENWRRPEQEVGFLMDLLFSTLGREVDRLHANGVSLRIVGDVSAFSDEVRQRIRDAEELTRHNTGLVVAIAINYGGRWDIAQAARQLARQVANGSMEPDAITPEVFGQHVALSDLPEPDLFIRTGGEQRISNFLIWQLAYTELHFTDVLWPDFDEQCLQKAFECYASRQRRFGRTGEQVERELRA